MTEHTPGPWEWDYNETVIADEGLVIAKIDPNRALLLKYTLANAALIAAAPDLLALVEAVEWDWDDICLWCGNEKRYGHADDCPRQCALARARGGGAGEEE